MFNNVINIAVIILSSYIPAATPSSISSSECIPNTQHLYIPSNIHEFHEQKSEFQLLDQQSIYQNGMHLKLILYQDMNDCKTTSQLIKELCDNTPPIHHLTAIDQQILNPHTIENIHIHDSKLSFQSKTNAQINELSQSQNLDSYRLNTQQNVNNPQSDLITNFKAVS